MTSTEIINIVCTYIPTCLSAIGLIIAIIVAIKRNKGVTTSAFLSLVIKLPAFIADAEKAGFSDGSYKLNYVMKLSIAYLATLLSKSTDEVTEEYGEMINQAIENILSTPQKKEENV